MELRTQPNDSTDITLGDLAAFRNKMSSWTDTLPGQEKTLMQEVLIRAAKSNEALSREALTASIEGAMSMSTEDALLSSVRQVPIAVPGAAGGEGGLQAAAPWSKVWPQHTGWDQIVDPPGWELVTNW
jgi:hypothetical protein